MNVRVANEQDRDRWDRFVLSSPTGSFLQSWVWGEFQQALTVPFWRLLVEHEGKLEAVALVIRRTLPFGRCWLYLPRGPHFAPPPGGATRGKPASQEAWEALQKKLIELARSERAIFITIDLLWSDKKEFLSDWRKSLREIQPRHTLVLDLTLSEEQLLAALHEKTRYNIRLASRKGVQVQFSTEPRAVEHFLRLARAVEHRSPFHYHPDEYYRTMLKVLGSVASSSEKVKLEVGLAQFQESVVAANIFVTAGATATYVHGASDEVHRKVMGPSLLMWEAIRRAKERGAKRFDFFGVASSQVGSEHPWAGITRFKEGFGGKREAYVGAYDLVLDSVRYMLYTAARKLKRILP